MATVKPIRDDSLQHPETEAEKLSGFESRCLYMRISECEEVVQQAILGADEACQKTHDAPELVRICEALQAADLNIVLAKRLAVHQLR
jgi:hypothetical protein